MNIMIQKWLRFFSALLLFSSYCLYAEQIDIETFFKKYPQPIYQDIIIQGKVVSQGTDLCAPRFELIRPILELYDKDFKLLDLGSAQGYFSFRTAREYPHSFCVMVDANTTSYYAYVKHGDMLYDLCLLNSDLNNICYLNKALTLNDLKYLNQNEHFDVIFGLLVVHLMYDNLASQVQVIDRLLSLGDNVILEVANDVAIRLTQYVESLSTKIECEYLGEVKRHYDPKSTSTGKLFWFKRDQTISRDSQKMQEEVLKYLNKVYPVDVQFNSTYNLQ